MSVTNSNNVIDARKHPVASFGSAKPEREKGSGLRNSRYQNLSGRVHRDNCGLYEGSYVAIDLKAPLMVLFDISQARVYSRGYSQRYLNYPGLFLHIYLYTDASIRAPHYIQDISEWFSTDSSS
jgi:hypothetical protein